MTYEIFACPHLLAPYLFGMIAGGGFAVLLLLGWRRSGASVTITPEGP